MNTHSKCVSASTLFALAGTLFLVGCHTESSECRPSDSYSMRANDSNTSVPTYNTNGNTYDDPARPNSNNPSVNVTRTPDEAMRDRRANRGDDVYTRDVQAGSHSPSTTTTTTNPPETYAVDRSREADRADRDRSRYDNRDDRYHDSTWYERRDAGYFTASGGMAGATDLQMSNAVTPPDNAYPMRGAYPRSIDWHFNGPSTNRYDASHDSYRQRDVRVDRDWDNGYRSDYYRRGNEYETTDQEGTKRVDREYSTRYYNTEREFTPDRMDRSYVDRRADSQNPRDTTPTPPGNNYDNTTTRADATSSSTSHNRDVRFYPVTRAEGDAVATTTGKDDTTYTRSVNDQTTIGTQKNMLASGMTVEQLTNDWPQEQKDAIKMLTAKYGQPAEATQSAVCWKNTGPFLYTKVMKDSVAHDFPKHHNDFLEQGIAYKVPADKAADLLAFDGSIMIDRTRGVLAARCDKEENNILALNLANDIIVGSKSVEDARNTMAQIATASGSDNNDYTKKLNFQSQSLAGDPDRAIDVRASTEGK